MATTTRQLADFIVEGGVQDIAVQQNPHIQPGTLQPAIAGKLLDGTTNHSGAYGTAQSDGHSYYYTDIKGSKPIKDPRIGAHFGSQRYPCKSVQLLEQETATHGEKVFSIDGREWMRVVGSRPTTTNNAHGQFCHVGNTGGDLKFIEIVGYFNQANWGSYANSHATRIITETVVNGGSAHTTDTSFVTTVATPLASRYVDAASIKKIEMETITSPQITTLKLVPVTNGYIDLYSIELIAQDTTSTANKSKIQIPSQNVVSYGKKFSLSSSPLHYNPFAFKTDGSTAWASGAHNGTSLPVGTGSSHNIDTATSLGLEKWKHSSNYYKPYNGGRVVIWVDSSGNIKTSVTVMPPNAKSMADSAISAKANASVANDTASPTFEAHTTDMHENNLSEVAKTFHFREFGNGAANGGTGGTWADASMLTNGDDDIAYVMDDGLTGVCAEDVQDQTHNNHIVPQVSNEKDIFFTFIGSGISYRVHHFGAGYYDVAQDLPYGTHIMTLQRNNAASTVSLWIDGVAITAAGMSGTYASITEPTFYQPKKPPIPEDACILADYMLMADFVPTASYGEHVCSKGTRWVSCTRDWFYDSGATITLSIAMSAHHGFRVYNNNATKDWKLPFFGNGIMIKHNVETGRSSNTTFKINSAAYGTGFSASGDYVAGNRVGSSHNTGGWDTSNNDGTYTISQQTNGANSEEFTGVKGLDLRVNEFWLDDNEAAYYTLSGAEIATPIHTSSHYQSFETPFLNELVGGDRNMEQTNLVVTPDGKTWDEVTRDTSYLSSTSLVVRHGTAGWSSTQEFTLVRGKQHDLNMISKEWITAYNKWLCLVDGIYQMGGELLHRYSAGIDLYHNGGVFSKIHPIANASDHNIHSVNSFNIIFEAKRGDTLHMTGEKHGAVWSNINIKKL